MDFYVNIKYLFVFQEKKFQDKINIRRTFSQTTLQQVPGVGGGGQIGLLYR